MVSVLKFLGLFAGAVLLLAILALGGVLVALNAAPGRSFVEAQINQRLGPQVHIAGLGGHFPADIKFASLSLADAQGIWVEGTDLELRWEPRALWRRDLRIMDLTADTLAIARAPLPGKAGKGGGMAPPDFRVDLDRLAVGDLHLGAAIAGTDITLAANGAAHLVAPGQGSVSLRATAANGRGSYALDGAIDGANVALSLHAVEPPDGLIGHFAEPRLNGPLALDASLNGPRDAAALNLTAALGAARFSLGGALGLEPAAPRADVTLKIPALAPFAAAAGVVAAGQATLHAVAARDADGVFTLALDGSLGLSSAPRGIAKLVGRDGKIAFQGSLNGQDIEIARARFDGAEISALVSGQVRNPHFDLTTHLALRDAAVLSPTISGGVTEDGTLAGTAGDFALAGTLAGTIREREIPSGPFSIAINAAHLPRAPTGTIAGSGALENHPLNLDAAFAMRPDGGAHVIIKQARWRSLAGQGDVSLAPGALLPTGQATFKIGSLADFAAFSPVPLRGRVSGDFAHPDQTDFKLDLEAQDLLFNPSLGPVNTTIHVAGPPRALAVRGTADVAELFKSPARLALAGGLDLPARSAKLATMSAAWHGLNATLLGPAGIETRPGLRVHHLAFALNGGRVALDGALTPELNASFSVENLPAQLASLFDPGLNASGTIAATARLTGPRLAPRGTFGLQARQIRFAQGPGAALPAADATLSGTLAGRSANVAAHLNAGADVAIAAQGLVPLTQNGALHLSVTGRADLRLIQPILAAQGTLVRGLVTADLLVTGSPAAPRANGTAALSGASVENVGSGLNLTDIGAGLNAAGKIVTLTSFEATAGAGRISAHGTLDLGSPNLPLDLAITAHNATPVASDIVSETLDAKLSLHGVLQGRMALGGAVILSKANINIPNALPPNVANLPILRAGAAPPAPAPPPPPVALDLTVKAANRIFIRGDGMFAELGGKLRITGTAAAPVPQGGFELIRGNISLAGKTLDFTQGTLEFTGDGFVPTLDLVATVTGNNVTATLTVGGTAEHPTITLTSTPPLPSDEILAELLFGQSTASLSPFQAASLAAALAQLSGVGGGINPLDRVRNALGLDELSLGGTGTGPPSVQAGRYVAPGIYVGAAQATNGQGTQASVQINLYKGLKLQTSTGTSSAGGGDSSSVGLTYQFNY